MGGSHNPPSQALLTLSGRASPSSALEGRAGSPRRGEPLPKIPPAYQAGGRRSGRHSFRALPDVRFRQGAPCRVPRPLDLPRLRRPAEVIARRPDSSEGAGGSRYLSTPRVADIMIRDALAGAVLRRSPILGRGCGRVCDANASTPGAGPLAPSLSSSHPPQHASDALRLTHAVCPPSVEVVSPLSSWRKTHSIGWHA